jgi:hypothetical protein
MQHLQDISTKCLLPCSEAYPQIIMHALKNIEVFCLKYTPSKELCPPDASVLRESVRLVSGECLGFMSN